RHRKRAPGWGAVHPGIDSVDPYRRPDGSFRDPGGHARLRLDRHGAGAAVPAGDRLLGPVAAAADQRRRGSFAWSGAQTLIAQLAEGDAHYVGRFSFFARL